MTEWISLTGTDTLEDVDSSSSPPPRPSLVDQATCHCQRAVSSTSPPAFDWQAYRDRDRVQLAINLLKQNRAVATRYYKRAANFDGAVQVASIQLRDLTRPGISA